MSTQVFSTSVFWINYGLATFLISSPPLLVQPACAVVESRKILKFRVSALKTSDSRFTLDVLASKTRIQKSHLSRVLSNQTHLSSEQLHCTAIICKFTEEEIEYLQRLLNWQRATLTPFKTHTLRSLKDFRRTRLGAQGTVKAEKIGTTINESERYYSQFFLPIVHMYLCIKTYANHPSRLQDRLSLSADSSILSLMN